MLVYTMKNGSSLHIRALVGPETNIRKTLQGFAPTDITELLKTEYSNVILSVDSCESEEMYSKFLSLEDSIEDEVKKEEIEKKCKLCGETRTDFPLDSFSICGDCLGIELSRLLANK